MKTSIHHVHLNVSDAGKSLPFYKSLLKYLGYKKVEEGPKHFGAGNGSTDLWIVQAERPRLHRMFHREEAALSHIAFRVTTLKAVRRFAAQYLKKKKIKTLYGSPRFFPEYRKGYFAVYFEDPDRVQLEVVYFPRAKGSRSKR